MGTIDEISGEGRGALVTAGSAENTPDEIAAAIRFLTALDATDLLPILGLNHDD